MRKVLKRKVTVLILILMSCCWIDLDATAQCDSLSLVLMEQTWREFRAIHPFSFQTVALKHKGDTCVFVMSEPSGWVKSEDLEKLFTEYGGQLIIGRQPFGYDGALYDAIGCAVLDSRKFEIFGRKLFRLLYSRLSEPCYTDLDNPSPHVFFSNIRLDDDISSFDRKNYVVWKIELPQTDKPDSLFLYKARKFTHNTDFIINVEYKDDSICVVGRRRQIPLSVFPPLRCETIKLLFSLDDKDFSVCLNPDSATLVSDSVDNDTIWATPITMSRKLQNTELGNLIFLSEIILNSWSENAKVRDLFIDYPKPPQYPFPNGVMQKLGYTPQYMWSIEHGSSTCISPVYRTMTDSVLVQLSQDAHSYIKNLNNTDLVRLAQYAFLYRALRPIREKGEQNLWEIPPENYEQWIQTPTSTISNHPWGSIDFQDD